MSERLPPIGPGKHWPSALLLGFGLFLAVAFMVAGVAFGVVQAVEAAAHAVRASDWVRP